MRLTRQKKCREHSMIYKAYLPIELYKNKISRSDFKFFAQRGVGRLRLLEALAIIKHVRKDIVPIRRLPGITNCLFLVHDRASGVPTTSDDRRAYIDLTLQTSRLVKFSKKWQFISQLTTPIDNVIYQQTSWYLQVVNKYNKLSDVDVLKQIGQYLHYFANMSQLVIY